MDAVPPVYRRIYTSNHHLQYEEGENAGTEIVTTSIREEMEQELINKSVNVQQKLTIATLPFTHDPLQRLAPNRYKAMRISNQQTKKFHRYPDDELDVVHSENKLQKSGHIDFFRNLSSNVQQQSKSSSIQNYIPWRAVLKLSSITKPCRLVFVTSYPTDTGYNLNSILVKGTHGMSKLVEIFTQWYSHKFDVTKMYNTIKLIQDQWCVQRYLWNGTLDVNQPSEEKIVNNDLDVDDCISGEANFDAAMKRADQMVVLSKGKDSRSVTMTHQIIYQRVATQLAWEDSSGIPNKTRCNRRVRTKLRQDGRIRKVAYKNANETVFRTSTRAVHELVIIHGACEESLSADLYEAFEHSKKSI